LFHEVMVPFCLGLRNRDLPLDCVFDLQATVDDILADSQPLPPREGPFRIVVPGEKRPASWVR
jgi:hypothetical protein